MAFFDTEKLKIELEYLTYSPYIPDTVKRLKKTTTDAYSPLRPYYELFLRGNSDATFHYNGVTTKVSGPIIGLLPHPSTALIPPEKQEYRIENSLSRCGGATLYFTSDTILAKNAEFFSCEGYFEELNALFESAHTIWLAKQPGFYNETMSMVYKIFALIQRKNLTTYIPSSKFALISKSIDYIDEHFLDNDFDCDTLPTFSGISMSYYNKLFTEKFHTSPKQYVLSKRLDHARVLLASTQYSIHEIAELCGFSDSYHFSKRFKKQFLSSPTEYRKKIQQDMYVIF